MTIFLAAFVLALATLGTLFAIIVAVSYVGYRFERRRGRLDLDRWERRLRAAVLAESDRRNRDFGRFR